MKKIHNEQNFKMLNEDMILQNHFSGIWLLATLWTVAHQYPRSMGFFQARILEWSAISFSKGEDMIGKSDFFFLVFPGGSEKDIFFGC